VDRIDILVAGAEGDRWLRVTAQPRRDCEGAIRGAVSTWTDVTHEHDDADARRQERRRLARAGDRFRRVLESVPDAIAVYHENRFGYGNAALVSMFGYESAAELVGKEVTNVLPGHTPLANGPSRSAPQLREERWRLADGKLAFVEIAAHAFALDDEEATLLIARDITARKLAQEQLIQAGRLASVGTLAAGVAHEINNPLSYVIANLDLLAEEIRELGTRSPLDHANELLQMTSAARDGAERVRKIVRGLKIFARADEERRVALDVHRVLEMSINMTFNEVRHRARLVKDYGQTPLVEADEGRLGQVFINLIVNAAQAIPEGRADKNEIRITTSTDAAGRAVVAVRDTGGGIPQDVLARIFDPFFTTKPIGIGTGLGLSICHGIIHELGGEISVESTPDIGTTVRVVLPRANAGAADEPTRTAPVTCSGPRGRVLVADDDAMVASALARLLSREHDVVAVNTAREALTRISAGEQFDIVLCDLMMPEMTGMEFHSELSRVAPAQVDRVVFITGGAFTPTARAFLDSVSNMQVEKPFDGHNLRAIVRRFVGAR
jgi:PAS domain S-box-containing protein